MSSPELHIKDSYYFELPKVLWPSARKTKADFPSVWIKNDAQFQSWEAERLCARLIDMDSSSSLGLPAAKQLIEEYEAWKHHDHKNFGKSFRVYAAEQREALHSQYQTWAKSHSQDAKKIDFAAWLKQPEQENAPGVWFARGMEVPNWASQWTKNCLWAGDVQEFVKSSEPATQWSPEKLAAYNYHLHGKILIPQPFGELRNFYQADSGLCISKFMVIQIVVALIVVAAFSWLARRVATGGTPRGTGWNLLESFLLFIRNDIARAAIHGAHDHQDESEVEGAHGDETHVPSPHGTGSPTPDGHHHVADHHVADHHGDDHPGGHDHDNPHAEADRFVPILWTIFMFVLGCNLMGMLPWLGAPTSSWGATVAMALVTFTVGFVVGVYRMGFFGYWANQVPKMGLPIFIAIFLIPMIFLIEVLGLVIKHGVLSIRLLANMVAGHVVLLSILAIAFSVEGAQSSMWNFSAPLVMFGSVALSLLELFVAFLQAYVFTFLSALFINAAINQH
ncbi:MAG: F0F1 ATP synthase subunit A [Planctomycetota bacterium]